MKGFRQYITEGGAFGHLQNLWDVDFTKQQLHDIIDKSLSLEFETAQIKTDGINLMVSVIDGIVRGARNKSHLKNYGENSMMIDDIKEKFRGRDVGDAYTAAMNDLQRAIGRLSEKQQQKIFANGKKWMSIEVIGHGAKNVVDYQGISELRLHGTLEVNEAGEFISQINKKDARILDGMLRQRSVNKQKTFEIRNLTKAEFRTISDAEKYKKELKSRLDKVLGGYNSISEYKEGELRKFIEKKTKNKELITLLLHRWLHGVKQPNIRQIQKEYPNETWIKDFDKSIGSVIKEIMLPLELVFLKLGSIVLGYLNVFMTKDPDATKKDIQQRLEDAISKIKASNDPKKLRKLNLELKRLEAAGGIDTIAPEEGITFFVGDEFIKLTGTFAPINQIIGMLYQK